jgi:hypothetical protein
MSQPINQTVPEILEGSKAWRSDGKESRRLETAPKQAMQNDTEKSVALRPLG